MNIQDKLSFIAGRLTAIKCPDQTDPSKMGMIKSYQIPAAKVKTQLLSPKATRGQSSPGRPARRPLPFSPTSLQPL